MNYLSCIRSTKGSNIPGRFGRVGPSSAGLTEPQLVQSSKSSVYSSHYHTMIQCSVQMITFQVVNSYRKRRIALAGHSSNVYTLVNKVCVTCAAEEESGHNAHQQ